MDQYSGLGFDLYNDGTVKVEPSLLTGLVGALLLFTGSLSQDFILKKVDIGSLSITVSTLHGLQYVCFSDYYDNHDYIKGKLEEIIAVVSTEIDPDNFLELNIDNKFDNTIRDIIFSKNFPIDIIPKSYEYLDAITINDDIYFENLLIADLNHGLVHSYSGDEDTARLLIELLAQLPFENNWTGESEKYMRNNKVVKECLLLSRIGRTDFFLLSKAIYKPSLYEEMVDQFNMFKEKLNDLIEEYGSD